MYACTHMYVCMYTCMHVYWWPGLRRTTGFGVPGPMTQNQSRMIFCQFIWNTRANDSESIADDFLSVYLEYQGQWHRINRGMLLFVYSIRGWEAPFMASRQNSSTYYRSCVYVLSALSTLRRNHHWVVGYRLSGRSVCVYVCMYTSMYVCICIYTYIHVRYTKHSAVHTYYMRIYVCICMWNHMYSPL